MLNYKEFMTNEEESSKTVAQKIRTQLSEKFDAISEAKKGKKPGDVNSEIESINKQAALYLEISALMKALTAEMKKVTPEEGSKESIY